MKNITLAVDEKVLEAARAYATSRGTTLNALVREHLAQLVDEDRRIAEARRGAARTHATIDRPTWSGLQVEPRRAL